MNLRLWSREKAKVKILQAELNSLNQNRFPKLRIDGNFGSKTQAAVINFQRSTGRLKADGIFGSKTLEEFRKKYPKTKLATGTSLTAPVQVINAVANKPLKFQTEIQKEFSKNGKISEWNTFINAIDQAAIPEMKKVLLSFQNAETARLLARTFLQLKAWGFSPREMRTVFTGLAKLNEAQLGKVFDVLATPTSKVGRLLSKTGGVVAKMGLLVTFVECVIHANSRNYAAIFGEVYKFFIGKRIPFVAMVDALQSLVELVIPKNKYTTAVFRIIKLFNPAGLGGIGVESVAASATAAYQWWDKGDVGATIPRLDKLVKRIKKSPAGFIAELGENAGKSAYELSRISSTEWGVIMRLNWRRFTSMF